MPNYLPSVSVSTVILRLFIPLRCKKHKSLPFQTNVRVVPSHGSRRDPSEPFKVTERDHKLTQSDARKPTFPFKQTGIPATVEVNAATPRLTQVFWLLIVVIDVSE
jgi:hypothetical protein